MQAVIIAIVSRINLLCLVPKPAIVWSAYMTAFERLRRFPSKLFEPSVIVAKP
jgi:hypothetical protein